MATEPVPVEAGVGTSAGDLYSHPGGSVTQAVVTSLDFTNTTASPITIDVWHRNAGDSQSRFLLDDATVPGKGTLSWRGMLTLDASGEKLRAQASATGVDVLGTVVEYS